MRIRLLPLIVGLCLHSTAWGDGSLVLSLKDQRTAQPLVARIEVFRAAAPQQLIPLRQAVKSRGGYLLDRSMEISLADGEYQYRILHGPEYRTMIGAFSLEKTSSDHKTLYLPRATDMDGRGWISGDCAIASPGSSLPLQMAAEDLHVAGVLGQSEAKPIPDRKPDDPLLFEPLWIRNDLIQHGGLIFYGAQQPLDTKRLPIQSVLDTRKDPQIKVAIENPFAWALPVWLASRQIDGIFLIGDWQRTDQQVLATGARPIQGDHLKDPTAVGRWAEKIYWNILDAGFKLAPLGGSGSDPGVTPVGYNRMYVDISADDDARKDANSPAEATSAQQWWDGVWGGRSIVTNGPLLWPQLSGKSPGHVFRSPSGRTLRLQAELGLAAKEQIEYVEVIHNGNVHYRARLSQLSQTRGLIPLLNVNESGWVLIRAITLHNNHYRFATTAPWYIEFDEQPRITADAVAFFQQWQQDYEQQLKALPDDQLQQAGPFVRHSRTFWKQRAEQATGNK